MANFVPTALTIAGGSRGGRKLSRDGIVLAASIVLLSLWLKTGFPIHAITNAAHDDALFIRSAAYLRAGHWLGPYDDRTLVKEMFYPLFITVASLLAVPLNIAEQIAYLAAAALTAWVVFRATGAGALSLLVLAALAFNPVVWTPELARVFRDALTISMAPGIVALAVVVAFDRPPPATTEWRRAARGPRPRARSGARRLLGSGEEGFWLLPALATVLALGALGAIRRDGATTARRLGSFTWPFGLATVAFAASVGAVAAMNQREYGAFVTSEVKATPFLRAYGALARIEQDQWRSHVVVPRDARERAYTVSPPPANWSPRSRVRSARRGARSAAISSG